MNQFINGEKNPSFFAVSGLHDMARPAREEALHTSIATAAACSLAGRWHWRDRLQYYNTVTLVKSKTGRFANSKIYYTLRHLYV